MLKILKGVLYFDQIEKKLYNAKIDNTHDSIIFSELLSIAEMMNRNKSKKQIILALSKNIKSKNYVIKLKGIITTHYIIKKTKNEQLIENFLDIYEKNINRTFPTERSLIGDISEYIQDYIISFYENYLIKFCLNFNAYKFARHYQTQQATTIQCINNGFQVINLINMILKTQQSFNKMGRYYISHNQILNLFMMYLDDLNIFNFFIKEASSKLLHQTKSLSNQEIKHNFLFMTQAQKTSDQLHQFFYNRYYFNTIKKIIFFPTFLQIQNNQFEELRNKVKQVDKSLLNLVSFSTISKSNYKTEVFTQRKDKNKYKNKNKRLETSAQYNNNTNESENCENQQIQNAYQSLTNDFHDEI